MQLHLLTAEWFSCPLGLALQHQKDGYEKTRINFCIYESWEKPVISMDSQLPPQKALSLTKTWENPLKLLNYPINWIKPNLDVWILVRAPQPSKQIAATKMTIFKIFSISTDRYNACITRFLRHRPNWVLLLYIKIAYELAVFHFGNDYLTDPKASE